MKEYLCRCNNCDAIMFDENPSTEALRIDISAIKEPILHMISCNDGGEFYWACPNCVTERYLTDLTPEDFNQ